jgi:hypothetical protein
MAGRNHKGTVKIGNLTEKRKKIVATLKGRVILILDLGQNDPLTPSRVASREDIENQ